MATLSLSDYEGGNCSVRAPTDALKVGWQRLWTVASLDCWFAQPKRHHKESPLTEDP